MYKISDIHNNDFFSFIDNIPDAVVITNNEGKIVLTNPQTEQIFGYSQEELLGESVGILMPERFHERHKKHLESYFNEPVIRPMGNGINIIGRRKDGSEVPLEISLSPWRDRDEVLAISAIRDITECKRIEKDLKWTNKKLEILNTVTQAVHKSLDLEEIYNVALDMASELENVDMAFIYLVDKDKNEAILQAYRNLPEDYIRRARKIPYPTGATWQVINSGKIVNIENVQKDTNIGQAGRELGHHSALGIPITTEGGVIGVLWFFSYKEQRFEEEQVALLTSIGNQIAMAIAKAELYRNLSRKSKYEKIVRTVTQNVHSSLDLQEVLDNAAESLIENIDVVNNVAIYMLEGEEAVLKAHRGLSDSFVERAGRIPYMKGFTWKTIIEGKPRYCADTEKDEYIGSAGRKEGIKSYLSMPIAYEGETIGCININSKQKNALDEEELNLLEVVSHQISIAIKNAQQAEALRESEERYRTLYDQSPVGVCLIGRDLKITHCNTSMIKIFQSSRDRIIGLDLRALKDKAFVPLIEAALKGSVGILESPYRATTSPAEIWLSVKTVPLSDNENNVHSVMGVVEDITERKRMEEKLIKTQKLESVGILAGGIAHDFNNLLTVIMGTISIARLHTEISSPIHEMLQEAENASLRATNLTKQLLTFSKGGEPVKELTSIEELIKESASFAASGSNVRCEYSFPQDLWFAEVDKGQIGQVINNLVLNAQQAMPEGGVVQLSAENTTVGKEHDTLREGRYVRISVKDAGMGIPEEYLQKIFDPYFTTKQRGSGLGLATSYSIISKHGGFITVDSTIGAGTTFTIYIPATGEPISEDEEAVQDTIEGGKGKIVVMDDEVLVSKVVGLILEDMGYEGRFARDGVEVLELYKEALAEGNPFDAVILDLTIPGGMGGKETIENLIKIDPNVKAIVSSGYSNDPVMANFEKYGFKGLVAKPYRAEELSQVLRKVICSEG